MVFGWRGSLQRGTAQRRDSGGSVDGSKAGGRRTSRFGFPVASPPPLPAEPPPVNQVTAAATGAAGGGAAAGGDDAPSRGGLLGEIGAFQRGKMSRVKRASMVQTSAGA